MPKILTEHNFSATNLKTLYKEVVVKPFNNSHSANNNDSDAIHFFQQRVKPYFQHMFLAYDGASVLYKAFTIIKKIRGEILNNILIAIDDSSTTNQLGRINGTIKVNIKRLIRANKNNLEEMQFNCRFCAEFRKLINQILGPITNNNFNVLNTNPILGAWRALDPQNNRRVGYDGYSNNIFGYTGIGELLLCGSPQANAHYGKIIVEAIAIYYLATKNSCSLSITLDFQEQTHRFGIFMTTLTEAVRGYNEGNSEGIDRPSCPGGIIGRLVEQSGYEQNIQFISKKTFINRIINDIVCKKVNEILSNVTTIETITQLLTVLNTSLGSDQQLRQIETTLLLRTQRYSLFGSITDNNLRFFQLIKNAIKQEKDAYNDPIVVILYQEIERYTYQTFVDAFLRMPEEYNQAILAGEEFSKELKLIGYAFSDPAYNCYPRVLNMCLAKIQQLQPQSQQVITDEIASRIAIEIIETLSQEFPTITARSLFNNTNNSKQADLSVIIGSYKSGANSLENEEDFLNRIIKKSYYDRDELGQEEEIYGLDSIINENLINRTFLIKKIANLILIKIKQQLDRNQQSVSIVASERSLFVEPIIIARLTEVPIDHALERALPQGYDEAREALLGTIVNQNLQHVLARTGHDENRSRYMFGIRNIRFTGPYSNTLDLPNVPVIHPYFPNGMGGNQLYDTGIPSFPIVVAIPQGTLGNLPSGVREQLIIHNININQLEVFFCVQNMPWHQDEQLLLRPHPWLHQDAPFSGNYARNDIIFVSTIAINARLETMMEANVNTHNDDGGEVIYSPNNMRIQGLNDFSQSHAFYSFCVTENAGRAVLTLHWLLNQQDHFRIVRLIHDTNSNGTGLCLREVIEWGDNIIGSRLNGGIRFAGEQAADITAIDALKSLVVGGQPEVLINNNEYRLVEQQVMRNAILALEQPVSGEELPLHMQPASIRVELGRRRFR